MTKSNLTTVLKAVENLVKRNRVAYRDFLGEETKTVQYCHGVIDGAQIEEQGYCLLTDDGGGELVVGETYQLTIDGVTRDIVAILSGLPAIIDWKRSIGVAFNPDIAAWVCPPVSSEAVPLLAGKTISLSKTTTEKKFKTRLLPDYLLPTWLRKDKIATKNAVDDALATAETAQSTANTAKTTAETAKTTAETAKTTAETAKTTAARGYWTGNRITDFGSVSSGVCAFSKTDTYPYTGIKIRNGESFGNYSEITMRTEYDTSSLEGYRLENRLNFSANRRVNNIPYQDGTVKVTLTGIYGIVLTSTAGKQFKITVDDTGTLTATEVTS